MDISFSSFSSITFFLFIIIVLLLLILGVYIYFRKNLNYQKELFHAQLEQEKERERNQTLLLSNISDDMYTLTQNLVNPEENNDEKLEVEILNTANNLRELLKIQANSIEIYMEKFVFSHILDDITTHLASHFSAYDTEVVFNVDTNVPRYLTGDVIHFSRIVNNILEFSIHATKKGTVSLEIACDKPLNDDIILTVMIQDSTKGWSKDKFDKLFELDYYFQKSEEWGLGLYIAKKLTLAMGGTIEVQSDMTQGNTFVLQIPMQRNADSGLKEFSALKEGLEPRKVLIYTKKLATGESLQQLFHYFYDEITLLTNVSLDKDMSIFKEHDILIVDEDFLADYSSGYLSRLKQETNKQIVSIRSIFAPERDEHNALVDSYIRVPSNLERVVSLIETLENTTIEIETTQEKNEITREGSLLVYKDSIEESPNIDLDCFTYFKGSRLLIVEDNLINQKIVLSVLKKSGMEIEIANNGQEALDLLNRDKKMFDIVLMDISMPVMDGIIATENIRKNPAYDSMVIIAFTAFAMGKEIEQMFDAGCNAYLTKPLNIKKLYHAFSMFLKPQQREVSLQKTIEIEGLDIEVGIYNADENEVLYKETLKEFVLVYKDMAESIPKWINEHRYERIKLACNEIAGILDAIGAYEMKALIDEIQKHFLYGNEIFLEEYVRTYPQKFNALLEAIEHYLGS